MSAGPDSPRREVAAIGLGLCVAPLAFCVVAAATGWLLVTILAGLGLDVDELDRDLLRLFSVNPAQALSLGYFIS